MEERRVSLIWTGLILLVFIFLAGLFWLDGRLMQGPANGEDFLPAWTGTRLFLREASSPYSPEAEEAIRDQYDELVAGQDAGPLPYLYPFYSVAVFAPFALIPDFPLALQSWMVLLETGILLVCLASIHLSNWRLSLGSRIALTILLGLWVYSVHPVFGGHASAIAALFLVGAFLAIRSKQDVLAGFLLASSTIKPQTTLLLLLFILIWAISNRRWLLVWSSVLFILVMSAMMSLFVPSWLLEYGRSLLVYWFKAPPSTPGSFISIAAPGVGRQVGWALAIFVIGTLLWEWRSALRQDFRHFYWTACLTLALTPLTGIPSSFENYIILIPAFVLVLSVWSERWGRLGQAMMVLSISALFIGLWVLFSNSQQTGIIPEENFTLFITLPLFLGIGLYWTRWWAIRPPRLPLESIGRYFR